LSLLAEERKRTILEELNRYGKVKVIALAERFLVSEETIRRDLDALERSGKLKRVYGGAVRKSYQEGEPPYQQRQCLNREAKAAIGRRAAGCLLDGDTVIIGTGTTVMELARAIQGRKRLTILTNSLPVAALLTESLNRHLFTGNVILLGGELNPEQQSVSGPLCIRMLERFHVDKAFISVGGISLANGISDYDLNESIMSQAMIAAAEEVIVLGDQSKIGVKAFYQIAPLAAVDVVISEQAEPSSWTTELNRKGINWMTAEMGDAP
jgi:DeoR family fructose operon transcriptional repressor